MLEALSQEIFGMPQLDYVKLLVRPLGALIFAGIIGFEREIGRRPAGLRTHMLISLAACVYALIMLTLLGQSKTLGDHVTTDPIRVVEAVTEGVAFLAAGLVVFTKGTVRGLTTGASMWLCAAVGLACGIGEWALAAFTTVMALCVITVIRLGEQKAGTYQKAPLDDRKAEESGHGR